MMNFENYYQKNENHAIFAKDAKIHFEKFKKIGIPTKKNEAWKYTNLNSWLEKSQIQDLTQNFLCDLSKLNFSLKIENSKIQNNKKDLIEIFNFNNCPQALKTKILSQLKENFKEDSLYQFALATTKNLEIIHIKENAQITEPILLERNNEDFNYVILADKNSSFEIFEIFNGEKSELKFIQQGITQVLLDSNAKIEHIQFNINDINNLSNIYSNCELKKDSNYKLIQVQLGNLMLRYNLNVNLNEIHANFEHYSFFKLKNSAHSDNVSSINCLASDVTATQLAKGLADENSHGIFNGLVFVGKSLKGVSTKQLNKNIILNNKAQIHSQPRLEVFSDDVKCAHGSTTGRLNSQELFYLQSRGIKKERALEILSVAFTNEILLKITNLNIRTIIAQNMFAQETTLAKI